MTVMKTTVFVATLIAGFATFVSAEQLPEPSGPVLLTISGAMENETSQGVVEFDMDTLASMETVEFTTSTIWLEENATFTGVALRDLLEFAGSTGSTISAVALNDYKIDIPVVEIEDDAPIVAYLLNGEAMTPRGKGPLWIVYPYDESDTYRSEVIYSRSIWQLNRIVSSE